MRLFRLPAALAAAGLCSACFESGSAGVDGGASDAATPDVARDVVVPSADIQLVDVGDPGDLGGESREIVGVEVDPMNASLTLAPGMATTQVFRAIGVRRDGRRVVLPTAVWAVGDRRLGDINGDGRFTASGVAGGEVEVRVTVTGARAMVLNGRAVLSVNARREVVDALTPNLPARFAAAPLRNDPARAARLLYPLDGAWMPNNVAPPAVQWERGVRGDAYRVRLAKPHAVTSIYLAHGGDGFPYATLIGDEVWRLAAESDLDADLVITVDRLDAVANEVVAGAPVRVRFSRGRVYGSVYYWNLLAGRMSRIRPDAARSEDLVPRPAPRADGVRCVACHTVSRDGRMLAAQVSSSAPGAGMVGGLFDLTADLTVDPAPTVSSAAMFQCASFSPDATRLVTCATGTWSGPLGMINPRTGAGITVGGLPTANATMPEWSPDGRNIAYIANVRLDGLGNPVAGDLALLRDPGDTPTIFDPPMVIHAGDALAMGSPPGAVDAYPTWSPDSSLIAFQHGAGAFSITGPGALYLLSRQGGTPWRLDLANGGAGGVDSYRPTFSPFVTDEGGGRRLLWLAYFSRRDYGNAQVGTRGTRRRQIWVTAVDASPQMGTDPSRVGYWLPGQDVSTENMSAYWSAEACRATGNECRTSADCCSGSCRQDPANPARFVCRAPEPEACRRRGQTCSTSSECCEGFMCYANVCDTPPA